MNRIALLCLGLIVVLPACGCVAGGFTAPDGYLKMDNSGQYDQRYVSARQNVIALRRVTNPKGGTADFWTQAIKQELVDTAGYQLKESTSVKAGKLDGTLFEFGTSIDMVEHTYLLAMFVDGQTIHLVEAAGRSDAMAADRDKLLASIRSLR